MLPRLSLSIVLGLWLACAGAAPEEPWPQALVPESAAVAALQQYTFAPRDEQRREGVRTDALLVIRDGRVVYERYAPGSGADIPHATWSISKSVMATVLGVAFGEGLLALDERAAALYAPLRGHPEIRLQHLLQWTSGLDWQEDYEYAPLNSSVVAMLYTRGRQDMARYAAQRPASSAAGAHWRYSSGDSNLLSAILRARLGAERYRRYPWQALFEPLGINHAVWETDAAGTFVASSYAYMSARDLARLGWLMANDGQWQGRQLLPKAWVEFNRTPVPVAPWLPDEPVAGGHWWLNVNRAWPAAPPATFAALGHWGQALYVLPAQRLVVVRFADDRDGSYRHNELLKRVLAAFAQPSP